MEGQGGSQQPHLVLADKLFLLRQPDVQDIDKVRFKDDVFTHVKDNDMVPLYETVIADSVLDLDRTLLDLMRAKIDDELKKLDEKIADAEENLGESEVREAHLAKSLFFIQIGDKEKALEHLKVTESKTVAVGQKMDLVFYTLQLGFFDMDFDLISKSINKAKNLFEEGGDWERKNRLKVYEGLYCMPTQNFNKAAKFFLDSLSTFTTYELFPYDTFIFYTVLTSIISLDRVSLKQKVVDAPEILTVIGKIPYLSEFLNSSYDCQYKSFFSAFVSAWYQWKQAMLPPLDLNYIKDKLSSQFCPWQHSFQFWVRAIDIYTGYKVFQVRVNFEKDVCKREALSERQHELAADKIYSMCTDLGGFFLKIAQIIGKLDLAPAAWVRRLVTLCDQAPATPFHTVKLTVGNELGHGIDDVFERFDLEPLGSASIAQVHRARLRGDKGDVVVKKQSIGLNREWRMKKVTAVLIFLISILCFQEIVHVSSSPLEHGNQVYEGSSGERNLKQEEEHAHELHCSRERSRAAWKVIEEYLTPFVERENYQLSRNCRLHPDNDIFRDQEEHKISFDRHEWLCGYCKKSFREEKFLDQHFDNRHYDLLNISHAKCLADLCGALHCDALMNSKSSRSKCNPAAAARNRHLCESLADSCFPISEGPSASRLHELFLHQFCDAHTCSGKQKPFRRGGKEQGSFFRLAAGALILVLLPVFYLFLYLIQSDMKSRTQELRRISKAGWKSKPS